MLNKVTSEPVANPPRMYLTVINITRRTVIWGRSNSNIFAVGIMIPIPKESKFE